MPSNLVSKEPSIFSIYKAVKHFMIVIATYRFSFYCCRRTLWEKNYYFWKNHDLPLSLKWTIIIIASILYYKVAMNDNVLYLAPSSSHPLCSQQRNISKVIPRSIVLSLQPVDMWPHLTPLLMQNHDSCHSSDNFLSVFTVSQTYFIQ